MDTITLAMESGIPLYRQLYEYIKSEIQSGRMKCNTRLPSKRKLSSYLKISQNTIQAAYDQLIEEGYVTSEERKGFFVCKLDNIIKLEVRNEEEPICFQNHHKSIQYNFSYNEVDFESFPFSTWRKLTKDVINEYDRELLRLGDSQGSLDLRKSIAEYLRQSRGVNCKADQIIISAGTEYLFPILIQLLNRNSIYGLENPGYERLGMLFKSNGARFKAVKIDASGMVPEEILKNGADIICITPSHQFPSGGIMPVNRRIQLLNWANSAKERFIIEDDYDSEFKYSGKPIPALQGLDNNGKVIYMGAFSKSLSPATRVSYMVLPEELLKIYRENLSFIICPVPGINQKVLHKFIEGGYFERHLNRMRNIYRKKREILVGELAKLNGSIEIIGADAGLHLLIKINNGMTEAQLVSSALSSGVKVYGLSQYYVDRRAMETDPILLLGCAALTEKEIIKAVSILNEAWF
jgi:GntR family transcriptional regulator/MocR family aminotransferase